MAIEKKRIQQRGGPYNQFDKSKTGEAERLRI